MKQTSLYLVRHAVVTVSNGKLYGQEDLPCDTSDKKKLAFLAERLPKEAVWVVSNLQRTVQTAKAVSETGDFALPSLIVEPDLAEQHFGSWQGLTWDEITEKSEHTVQEFWRRPSAICPPDGESFEDLRARVDPVVSKLLDDYNGKDIVFSIHGGTVRAILAHALGIASDKAVNIVIDNLSLSTLTYFKQDVWRVEGINLL
ncbi:MAG: histidine phosphatase family protein [Rhodospirillales bacterium]|nr:histidine phosphatase family protein [Rhodospirillales bacterium]